MLKSLDLSYHLKYALVCAICYSIPVFFVLKDAKYTETWLLFLGNALFLFCMIAFMVFFNKKRNENASAMTMLLSGHVTAVLGVLISCLIAFILMIIFVPGLFNNGTAHKLMRAVPANFIQDKTRGMIFIVFVNAIFGNISAGSFASIITAYTAKRDQTGDQPEIELPVKK